MRSARDPFSKAAHTRMRLDANAAPADRPFDSDRLNSLPLHEVTSAAFSALHPLQNLTPEQQVAGIAVLYATMCKRVGLTGQGMWEYAERILATPDTPENHVTSNQLQALRDYMGVRVAGERGVSIG